jgi:hypothetical protein
VLVRNVGRAVAAAHSAQGSHIAGDPRPAHQQAVAAAVVLRAPTDDPGREALARGHKIGHGRPDAFRHVPGAKLEARPPDLRKWQAMARDDL